MNILETLKHYFGYDSLRQGQDTLINGILSGRDALGIMPTGAGKSLCYQLPAVMLDGITIVISPLISLMIDQVTALNQLGIRAAYINSALSERQIQLALYYASQGEYKIIYVAPERLGTERFLEFARHAGICMVTVDEAHCISQWGHNFRTSYMEIPVFLNNLPHRPIVTAFTATATERVKQDILRNLNLRQPLTVVTGFDRPNLFFRVIHRRGGAETDYSVLNYVKNHTYESGIIYCATRKNVDKVWDILRQNGIAAGHYHAGMSSEERRQSQDDFIYDRIHVMVATNAFGMGIDKSNVRYVLHYNMPQSLEYYYQEAGRAGRDGEEAECVLFFSRQDIMINKFLLRRKADSGDASGDSEISESDALKLNQMIEYCETDRCLRQYILSYFGDTTPCSCNKCSSCVITEDETAAEIYTGSRKKAMLMADLTPAGDELFEKLRSCRAILAGNKKVPPYSICSDKTLKDMCVKCPTTPEAMLEVYGMGRYKVSAYGDVFAYTISVFLKERQYDPVTFRAMIDAGKGKAAAARKKKQEFYIEPKELEKTEITDTCRLTELVERINDLCTDYTRKRLTAKFVNTLLLEEEYLEEVELDGKSSKHATEKGLAAGIKHEERLSSYGNSYYAIAHTRESQQLILKLLQRYYTEHPEDDG